MSTALSIGRIVHFVLPNGQHRPAIVTRVWTPVCGQLAVFTDIANDARDVPEAVAQLVEYRSSVMEGTGPGTWHWPERE